MLKILPSPSDVYTEERKESVGRDAMGTFQVSQGMISSIYLCPLLYFLTYYMHLFPPKNQPPQIGVHVLSSKSGFLVGKEAVLETLYMAGSCKGDCQGGGVLY